MSDTPRMDAVRDYTCPEIMYREGCRLERELAEAREAEQRFQKECEALAIQRSNLFKTINELRDKLNAAQEAGEVGK